MASTKIELAQTLSHDEGKDMEAAIKAPERYVWDDHT
jgi:hypothetical protein